MSEEKLSYMEQLDVWIAQTVIEPLRQAGQSQNGIAWSRARDGVYEAIKDKVLESYKNGLKAGATKPARKAPHGHAQR